MNSILIFFSSFMKRGGGYVFSATITSRIISFITQIAVLKIIPNKELGIVLFAYNIIVFTLPFSGLGLQQSLIRYGALLKTKAEKDSLFKYVLKYGMLSSAILVGVVILVTSFISFQFEETQKYVSLLSLVIFTSFIYECISVQLRLNHDNKSFALADVSYNIISLVGVVVLSYLFQEIGYIAALIITPLINSLFYFKRLNISIEDSLKKIKIGFDFWTYGIFASLSNVATQLLFIIDILLIGHLLSDSELITTYKYITLIPFSILYLPRIIINTDYVSFTEKIFDKEYIHNYIKNYLKLFLVISVVLIAISILFSQQILLLFDESFVAYSDTFILLMIGIAGILIFRGLYGNLLASIGKAKLNYYIASVALIINVISNYYLIPNYGIKGAAITSCVLMWLTGLSSCLLFYWNYKK
jgi:O-antigen/teichoic acid export membrane protein